MYTIYALVDQRHSTTRYIGITDNVYARFSQHLRCDGRNPRKDVWVQELRAAQVMLIMQTIEVVETVEEARNRESYWIQHFLSEGAKLLNQQLPVNFSYEDFMAFFKKEDTRQKASESIPQIHHYAAPSSGTVSFEEASGITGYTVSTLKKYASQGKVKRSKRDENLLLLSSLAGMRNKLKPLQTDKFPVVELMNGNNHH